MTGHARLMVAGAWPLSEKRDHALLAASYPRLELWWFIPATDDGEFR